MAALQKNKNLDEIEVIAPNLKRRLSGVTTTVLRLVPKQANLIGIVTTGPGLPAGIPHVSLWRAAIAPRRRWRVWHARRNTEMILGLFLRHILRRRFRLLFTSAAQRAHKPFTKWLIARMDRVVATSPQAASYLDRDATVIMHGVDTNLFSPTDDKAALRSELGLPTGLLIGCFGRVRHQKGVDVLVEAALRIMPDRPDINIVFTGLITNDNQKFVADLQAKLATAGLAEQVQFRGEVDWGDLIKYFKCLDLFVAPARWEGFGLTPIEAMACGVPAVATTVGAFEAQIVEGITGRLVPPGDIDALAEAITDITRNPPELLAAGKAAREHVVSNFRIEGEAEALVAVYRDILDNSAP